jgi:hypothetical protein
MNNTTQINEIQLNCLAEGRFEEKTLKVTDRQGNTKYVRSYTYHYNQSEIETLRKIYSSL